MNYVVGHERDFVSVYRVYSVTTTYDTVCYLLVLFVGDGIKHFPQPVFR
jgi:hypothetical protein